MYKDDKKGKLYKTNMNTWFISGYNCENMEMNKQLIGTIYKKKKYLFLKFFVIRKILRKKTNARYIFEVILFL